MPCRFLQMRKFCTQSSHNLALLIFYFFLSSDIRQHILHTFVMKKLQLSISDFLIPITLVWYCTSETHFWIHPPLNHIIRFEILQNFGTLTEEMYHLDFLSPKTIRIPLKNIASINECITFESNIVINLQRSWIKLYYISMSTNYSNSNQSTYRRQSIVLTLDFRLFSNVIGGNSNLRIAQPSTQIYGIPFLVFSKRFRTFNSHSPE